MEKDYAKPVALKALENRVNNFKPRVPSPSRPPAPPGGGRREDPTGLDEEMETADVPNKKS